MNARERVLAAYNNRCAWCQREGVPLEIDHITEVTGPGNAHRKAILKRIEYWLCDEFQRTGSWPAGFQTLCVACHSAKSGRRPRVAITGKKKQVNVQLDEGLVQFLDYSVAAGTHGESKSEVLGAALQHLMDAQTDALVVQGLQQQLSTLRAELLEAVKTPMAGGAPELLAQRLTGIETRLTHLQDDLKEVCSDVHCLYDLLQDRLPRRDLTGWRATLARLLGLL